MSNTIKDYIVFPTIYTFKIIGENSPTFTFGVEELFSGYAEVSIVPTFSGGGKYISMSVTLELEEYEELEKLYESISRLNGLKFHV